MTSIGQSVQKLLSRNTDRHTHTDRQTCKTFTYPLSRVVKIRLAFSAAHFKHWYFASEKPEFADVHWLIQSRSTGLHCNLRSVLNMDTTLSKIIPPDYQSVRGIQMNLPQQLEVYSPRFTDNQIKFILVISYSIERFVSEYSIYCCKNKVYCLFQ